MRAPPFPSLVHWGHCCVPCIYPFFTSYQEKLGLSLHSGKERVHLRNICSMIKIASNNKERRMQADMFPAAGILWSAICKKPYKLCPWAQTSCGNSSGAPSSQPQSITSYSMCAGSCISALCPSLGLASCPGFRAKEAALSGPPQPRFWLRSSEGWHRRVNSRANPYRKQPHVMTGPPVWKLKCLKSPSQKE